MPENPKDPDRELEDLYGSDLPSAEEVSAESIKHVGEPTAAQSARPENPPPGIDNEELDPVRSPLRAALGDRDINEILPQLSEKERLLLYARFDLATGEPAVSQRRAADILGVERTGYNEQESELMALISQLAGETPLKGESE
jgi:hypothetical protein